jgi:hypothetical protein
MTFRIDFSHRIKGEHYASALIFEDIALKAGKIRPRGK